MRASIFVLRWTTQNKDATTPIQCSGCGSSFFSDSRNLHTAHERGMLILCFPCAQHLAAETGDLLSFGGGIKAGIVRE